MRNYAFDIESLDPDGDFSIHVIPDKNQEPMFYKTSEPFSFTCPFDTEKKSISRFMRALMAPERKTTRRRGKKMLVMKRSMQVVNMRFDLATINRLGL